MIRDRRVEDLDRLREVLGTVDRPPSLGPAQDPGEWLTQVDAEWSWVFDQAPVTAVPTRNVIGHLQVGDPSAPELVDLLGTVGTQTGSPLVVRRFFVTGPHATNVARYLLTQAVDRVVGLGRLPVVDLRDTCSFPASLFARRGFVPVPASGPGGLIVLSGPPHRRRSRT